jgi:hypothetical protein
VQGLLAAKQAVGGQPGQLVPSLIHRGYRIRAVGNRIYWRPLTQTFHEFLLDILKETVGKKWYMGQVGLPPNQHHQIYRWLVSLARHTDSVVGNEACRDGEVWGSAPTGDVLAVATLGYDLLHLQHYRVLPQRVVDRLTSRQGFQGALYEIAIAASFVRAGFSVQFIDDDTATKHAEFIATDPGTGLSIEVETRAGTVEACFISPAL